MAVVSVALLQSTSQLAVFDLWRLKNHTTEKKFILFDRDLRVWHIIS